MEERTRVAKCFLQLAAARPGGYLPRRPPMLKRTYPSLGRLPPLLRRERLIWTGRVGWPIVGPGVGNGRHDQLNIRLPDGRARSWNKREDDHNNASRHHRHRTGEKPDRRNGSVSVGCPMVARLVRSPAPPPAGLGLEQRKARRVTSGFRGNQNGAFCRAGAGSAPQRQRVLRR